MSVDPVAVADAFLKNYAGLSGAAKRDDIAGLYGEDSLMSTDGSNVKGRAGIGGVLATQFAGGPVARRFTSQDSLPSMASGGIIVLVTGDISVGGKAAKCTEVFVLFPAAGGALYVRNNLFRTGPGVLPMNNAAGGDLAMSFTESYYKIFDSDRRSLAGIYRDGSFLAFEGTPVVTGPAAIVEKLMALPGTRHTIETLDSQPIQDKVTLVLITGKIVLEGQENALMFTQLFQIVVDDKGPYVSNDIFRLNYG